MAKITRYGKITIESYKGSYRLRWTLDHKTYSLTINGGLTKEAYQAATGKAQLINGDIALERFDITLVKYDSRKEIKTKIEPELKKELNLKEIWERYKKAKDRTTAKSSKLKRWSVTDKVINSLNSEQLRLENADIVFNIALDLYKPSTVSHILICINAAINMAVEQGLIEKNPYRKLKKLLPKKTEESSRSKQGFTIEETKTILEAFATDRFLSKYAPDSITHSYYLCYVTFLAVTGCRPEEAIALTWNDIKYDSKGRINQISFNKAYTHGEVRPVKNNKPRIFNCNLTIIEFLENAPRIPNKNNLVFPSVEGNYITQANFLRKLWKPIVTKLVELGEIEKYLPTYNQRNTWITAMINNGLDIGSTARLAGTSEKMILEHYLTYNEKAIPPEFF